MNKIKNYVLGLSFLALSTQAYSMNNENLETKLDTVPEPKIYAQEIIPNCLEKEEPLELLLTKKEQRPRKIKQAATLQVIDHYKNTINEHFQEEKWDEIIEDVQVLQCVMREGQDDLNRRTKKEVFEDYMIFTGELAQPILQKQYDDIKAPEWERLFRLRTTHIPELDNLYESRHFALSYLNKYTNTNHGNMDVVNAIEKGIDMLIEVHQYQKIHKDEALRDFRKAIRIMNQQDPTNKSEFMRNIGKKISKETNIYL